jgi:hypothetical protein
MLPSRAAIRHGRYRRSASALQLAPAAGPVVGDDLPEHRDESGRVDALSVAYGYSAGGLVVVTARNDPVGVWDNAAVVKEYVDVIFRRQQRADVTASARRRSPPYGKRCRRSSPGLAEDSRTTCRSCAVTGPDPAASRGKLVLLTPGGPGRAGRLPPPGGRGRAALAGAVRRRRARRAPAVAAVSHRPARRRAAAARPGPAALSRRVAGGRALPQADHRYAPRSSRCAAPLSDGATPRRMARRQLRQRAP